MIPVLKPIWHTYMFTFLLLSAHQTGDITCVLLISACSCASKVQLLSLIPLRVLRNSWGAKQCHPG